MVINKQQNNIQVPVEAKYVIYLLPRTKTTIQRTLLWETEEFAHNKISRNWKDIKDADLWWYSYGVKFKDEKYQELPETYIIRAQWGVKNIFDAYDLVEKNWEYGVESDFEQAEISNALASTGLTHYIKAELNDILAYIPFDPCTMILVEETEKPQSVSYRPLHMPKDFGVLRRSEAYFTKQYLTEQPFITWSDEQASIDFVAEYYRYSCNPTEYPWTKVREIWYNDERFDLTPEVINNMSTKLNISFPDLKVFPFFEKIGENTYRASHDLLCHMFLMNWLASVPFYLASGHLWNPEITAAQFDYYLGLLIHDTPNIIPNKSWLMEILNRTISIIKKTPWRLMEIDIDAKELVDLLAKGPYEDLIVNQLCLFNYITEGDTIWFKLTPTGAMFLYMCCPNVSAYGLS